ncbi:2-phospho-L-lactate guanylyltransferase [Ktedonosporobacter rubrisoli]|uniref:Phosphoenolpyruvate guanylyltransferase n=2 Tax=Ktedonosporobacter rubrisoli TaxID=2509675 RepID=A0A4P6K5K0_KTERU|nr:2-phospho-L-lactate guanylyltransferase [Ktedonosporobacter rubrisoli]
MINRALIPVKALDRAKSRLSKHLTPNQRAFLVLEMLHHVICTLQESAVLTSITVVSPDERVLEQVQAWGAQALLEEQHGHNTALHAAALHQIEAGTTALLTISADLPLLQVSDVRTMFEQVQSHDIVLAPSREGTGTNALLVSPPLVVPYVFGPGSLQRYQLEAQQRDLKSALARNIGLALDIDTIEDLRTLRRYEMRNKAAHAS